MALPKELLILRFCPLFRSFDEDGLDKILTGVKWKTATFKKDSIIAFADDVCDELLIPLKGSVRGEMVDSAGRCLKIEDIKAPMPLAAAFVFGKENRYPVNVIANSEVTIFSLPQKAILQIMLKEPCFLHVFLNLISNRVQFLTEKISFLSFHTIREKLAHYLLKHAGDKDELTLPGSQERMAELFGVARPSFARGLGELKDDGIIDVKRREVTILDRTALVKCLEK